MCFSYFSGSCGVLPVCFLIAGSLFYFGVVFCLGVVLVSFVSRRVFF